VSPHKILHCESKSTATHRHPATKKTCASLIIADWPKSRIICTDVQASKIFCHLHYALCVTVRTQEDSRIFFSVPRFPYRKSLLCRIFFVMEMSSFLCVRSLRITSSVFSCQCYCSVPWRVPSPTFSFLSLLRFSHLNSILCLKIISPASSCGVRMYSPASSS